MSNLAALVIFGFSTIVDFMKSRHSMLVFCAALLTAMCNTGNALQYTVEVSEQNHAQLPYAFEVVHESFEDITEITVVVRMKAKPVSTDSYATMELHTSTNDFLASAQIERWQPPRKSRFYKDSSEGNLVCWRMRLNQNQLNAVTFRFADMSGPFVDTYVIPISKPFG